MKCEKNTSYLFFLMIIAVISAVGCGTTGQQYKYSWEIYEVEKSVYLAERGKLVDSVENTLFRNRFYPEEKQNLTEPGEGTLMTDWNEDAAKNARGSYEGFRLRVHIIVTDDLSEFETRNDDPILDRYMSAKKEEEIEKVKIGLAVAVEKEINTSMPKYKGETKTARWEYEGEDLETARKLHYEILEAFNLKAKNPINADDYMSDEMKRILGQNPDKKDDKKDDKKPKDDFRILD